MPTAPQPSVNFHARIDLETEARRRRLQALTGLSASQLVKRAFRELERVTPAVARRLPLPNANSPADLTGP
jgi:hypothetical protein